jgi:23S rRNA (cytosine1962-C5)-methyltransferase
LKEIYRTMLKTLVLEAKKSSSLLKGNLEFYQNDFQDFPKSLFPGEWVQVMDPISNANYLAYVNPFAEKTPPIRIVEPLPSKLEAGINEEEQAKKIILKNLAYAKKKRDMFSNYRNGMRLVHGSSDNLPGLTVDIYKECILVQVNTAGMDRFRAEIKDFLKKTYLDKKIFFLDMEKVRQKEGLPKFEEEKPDNLIIEENGLCYKISGEILQKIGFYYDHRENRKKLERKIGELDITLKQGLDLFSYVGSWGLHMLRSKVSMVTFVDQGNFENEINGNLKDNGFSGRGNFLRQDVFKFLDESIEKGSNFDIIVSDPPAFSKETKNIQNALLGYEKLHRKIMKVLSPTSLFVAASCTHGISFEDFANTVNLAAIKENRKIQILDIGIQGGDHPFSSFESREFYLKYILYLVR